MKRITAWMKSYVASQSFQPASIGPLKAMNYVLALQAFVVGLFLMGSHDLFLQPRPGFDAIWLAPNVAGVDIWEVAFIASAIILVFATIALKGVKTAHALSAAAWLLFGFAWTIGGIISAPSYLFGVGIFGIFAAFLHIGIIGVWRAEGV